MISPVTVIVIRPVQNSGTFLCGLPYYG